jgi:hypothetical protein
VQGEPILETVIFLKTEIFDLNIFLSEHLYYAHKEPWLYKKAVINGISVLSL